MDIPFKIRATHKWDTTALTSIQNPKTIVSSLKEANKYSSGFFDSKHVLIIVDENKAEITEFKTMGLYQY